MSQYFEQYVTLRMLRKLNFFNCSMYKAASIFDWSYYSNIVYILYESVDEGLQYLPSSHKFHFLSYPFQFDIPYP